MHTNRYKKGFWRDVLDTVLLVLFILLVLVIFNPGAEAAEPIPHPWDYVSHAVGGAVVVELVEPETTLEAVAWTGAVGVAKELADRNFDEADALARVVGGVLYHQYKVRVRSHDGAVVVGTRLEF